MTGRGVGYFIPSTTLSVDWSELYRPQISDLICGEYLYSFQHFCTLTGPCLMTLICVLIMIRARIMTSHARCLILLM